MQVFNDYAYYYNAFYGDKDYAKEAADVDSLLRKVKQNGGGGTMVRYALLDYSPTILELGCGTGRHAREFALMGYDVHGIDISENMVSIAKKNAIEHTRFDVADVRTYKAKRKYDSVLSLFHVMSYQTSNEDIIAAFKTAGNALDEGGVFVFDVWYGPGVLSEKPAVRVKKVEDENNILVRYANPVCHEEADTVDVVYDVIVIDKKTGTARQINETHKMRYFFRPEVELMLNMAGMELIDCVDCNTLKSTAFDSWTAYFMARRKGE